MQGHLLLIPEKPDEEPDSVAMAWEKRGGSVLRIGKFWIKPDTGNNQVSIYGGLTFTTVLAQVLSIELISPNDEIIATLENEWIKRAISVSTLKEAPGITFPKFVKPVVAKQFAAQTYASLAALLQETTGLGMDTRILVSEVVEIKQEVRCFVFERKIMDAAFYEGCGTLADATSFAQAFLNGCTQKLPISFVLDLGYNDNKEWFIIELNAAWGSGLNGCRANKVLTAIQSASNLAQ